MTDICSTDTSSRNSGFLPEAGLQWLLRLRWVAVAGQFLTCLCTRTLLGIPLPWVPLSICLAVTIATNGLAHLRPHWLPRREEAACALLLAQDTAILAGMLWWTGGTTNPFAAFFLLHLAMASILLPSRWAASFLIFASVCFGVQFLSPPFPAPRELLGAGRIAALFLVGASIAFFIGRLRIALMRGQADLAVERQHAERNERFASVATLAAGVAHELATPLSTIAVICSDFDRFRPGEGNEDEFRHDALLIRSEVERCRAVLEGLSDRATSGVGDSPELFDLHEIRGRLVDYLPASHWERVVFACDDTIAPFWTPVPPLLQSLAALIKNACEASDHSQPVSLAIEVDDDRIRFSVVDRGDGMSPEFLRKIGEPFLTTKAPGIGMGLGVFLVRTFAERMQGTLGIESTPGAGTTMRLVLPIAPKVPA